jgi:16S rRNA (adenine1518-N6/adenine1519-N6)-dimethyltransferase
MDHLKAKKQFGQNFIHDQKLITKIVNLLGDDPDALVIEIGPGKGALTKQLAAKFAKVIAIEIDTDMEPVLKKAVPNDNFELILQDALTVDYEALIKANGFKTVYLISNMPYYITSEILFKAFNLHEYLKKAVFMMQKEVALRVCAHVNEPDYNNLSIATEFYAKRKYEFTVNKGMFNPIPKVDSAIVSLEFYDQYLLQVENPQKFLDFVRNLFNNKRKTILNNLGRVLNDKQLAQKALETTGIKPNLRPENLTLQDYLKIYAQIR